ncbi:glutathione S-transferase family protein [Agrobacterium rhizogenes]|uniref:glutathione S-transferase family protein n=1 Tax=Rhizobium rhizogenes TaxID=359 RepID=UPI00115E5895|nr:glutathione S-transferase family protein [Rhizobium rhizogenes]NTG25056.1 glutathione S-transferase family protein [Rhizobium rhizogenes]NTH42759.1 glutathione S-transferase family protein [Rhizobium rhizogenes]NTH55377.1 glutathione S-transferase family protein [Rhizobium rhizogenes]NTH74958.1 glutathione S-transferase family protein [Rhizobium rhizogenes]NTJ04907.1 glutathione S-transferase family protein [Rhizobium rhizogenes]
MTGKPRLFGADYSVYVRIARLCLIEKGIGYHLVPLDVFADGGPPADYLARHPFGRIPAFEHGGFSLYETGAIARYIDEAFEGPKLQPSDAVHRARCNQLISVADNYAYPQLVWGIYVERMSKPARGVPTDEEKLAAALPKARSCLAAMSDLMGDGPWLVGEQLTLADIYAAPMFDYFLMAPAGVELINQYANLKAWWSGIASRPSMAATKPT